MVNSVRQNGQKETSWLVLEFWGKQAKIAAEQVKKGFYIVAEADSIVLRKWKTAESKEERVEIGLHVTKFKVHAPVNQETKINVSIEELYNIMKILNPATAENPEKKLLRKEEELLDQLEKLQYSIKALRESRSTHETIGDLFTT
jgi:single-stranded DNA-binding protein